MHIACIGCDVAVFRYADGIWSAAELYTISSDIAGSDVVVDISRSGPMVIADRLLISVVDSQSRVQSCPVEAPVAQMGIDALKLRLYDSCID